MEVAVCELFSSLYLFIYDEGIQSHYMNHHDCVCLKQVLLSTAYYRNDPMKYGLAMIFEYQELLLLPTLQSSRK